MIFETCHALSHVMKGDVTAVVDCSLPEVLRCFHSKQFWPKVTSLNILAASFAQCPFPAA